LGYQNLAKDLLGLLPIPKPKVGKVIVCCYQLKNQKTVVPKIQQQPCSKQMEAKFVGISKTLGWEI
jgi:hypothetical protein